ncbi:MAG TPA: O-antigen ligase family protein [Candidatus Dormibacteraeota bacterium]|nr:O-antigen ligase family protein [Candidatus Dormibacteraeota bacterium]
MSAAASLPAPGVRRRRPASQVSGLLIVCSGSLAGALALRAPVPVIGAIVVAVLALGVLARPSVALVAAFALIPFHIAAYDALTVRAGVDPGQLALWKDALLVSLLARGVFDRVRAGAPAGPRSPGDLLLVAYVGLLSVLALASPNLHAAGNALAADVEGPLLLLAIVALAPPRRVLVACLVAIAAVAAVMAAGALVEQGLHEGFPRWFGREPDSEVYYSDLVTRTGYRSGSFLGDSLVLGFFLSATTGAALALVAMARTSGERLLALAGLALGIAGTAVTYTRSAYAGVGVGVVVGIVLLARPPRIRAALVGLVVVAAGSVVLGLTLSGDQHLTHGGDAQVHLDIVGGDLDLIALRPLGYGLGTTDAIARRFDVREVSQTSGTAGAVGPSAESVYLGAAVEAGVLGFVVYMASLFTILLRLIHARRRALGAADGVAAAATGGAIATLLATAVAGLVLPIRELPVEIMWWGIPGLALVLAGERLQPAATAPGHRPGQAGGGTPAAAGTGS